MPMKAKYSDAEHEWARLYRRQSYARKKAAYLAGTACRCGEEKAAGEERCPACW